MSIGSQMGLHWLPNIRTECLINDLLVALFASPRPARVQSFRSLCNVFFAFSYPSHLKPKAWKTPGVMMRRGPCALAHMLCTLRCTTCFQPIAFELLAHSLLPFNLRHPADHPTGARHSAHPTSTSQLDSTCGSRRHLHRNGLPV